MIIMLNGTFGVGKTTVARQLVQQLPQSLFYDPEIVGSALLRLYPAARRPADFQDLSLWRRMTFHLPRLLHAAGQRTVVMPMTIWRKDYFSEIVDRLRETEQAVYHFTLLAEPDVLEARIHASNEAVEWRLQHLARCASALADDTFAVHIDTTHLTPDEVTTQILAQLPALTS